MNVDCCDCGFHSHWFNTHCFTDLLHYTCEHSCCLLCSTRAFGISRVNRHVTTNNLWWWHGDGTVQRLSRVLQHIFFSYSGFRPETHLVKVIRGLCQQHFQIEQRSIILVRVHFLSILTWHLPHTKPCSFTTVPMHAHSRQYTHKCTICGQATA